MATFNAGAIEANLTLGRSSWTRDLKTVKKEIADLEKTTITIGIDADDTNARIVMDNLEMMLEHFDEQTYTPEIDVVINEAQEALQRLEERLDRLDARQVVVAADADVDNALIQLSLLEDEMDVLENDPVDITADADVSAAMQSLAELEAAAEAVAANEININADVQTSDVMDDLALLEAQIAAVDGQTIDIGVDYDQGLMDSMVGAATGGGGGHLGLLKILLYAIIILSPILSVAMGSMTAALIGFAAALVGAIGPVAILAAGMVGLIQRFKEAKAAGELTPAMEALDYALTGLTDAWNTFLDAIEVEGFNLMGQAISILAGILPTLSPLFNETARMLSGVLDGVAEFVNSPEYDEMLAFFGGFGVDMLESFLRIGGNLLQFFGRLFQAIEPFAREMMGGLEEVTAGWAEWADDLENNEAFQEFVANALEYGPMLLDMLGSLLAAFMAIGRALEPFAGPMLEGLTFLFDLIANAPTEVLTALIAGFAGLWLGMSVIAPLLGVVASGLTAVSVALGIGLGPVILIAAALAGLVAIIIHLWRTNDTFREAVISTWEAIRNAVAPIVEDLVAVIRDNWGPIKEWVLEIFNSIASIITDAMVSVRQIVRAVAWAVTQIWNLMGKGWIQIIKSVVQAIMGVVRGFMTMMKGIFQVIRGVLTGNWRLAWEGIKNIGRGAIQIIVSWIRGLLGSARGIFMNIRSAVTGIWNGLWGVLRNAFSNFRGWIEGRWQAFLGMFRIAIRVGDIFSGIRDAFRNAVNAIIDWWNGLSFGIPGFDPPGPGKFPGITVSTPNIGRFADGGWITEPTLGLIGEGGENEVIAPEPMLKQIVKENSGADIDYGRLARAVAIALAAILPRSITAEDLQRLIEAASVNIDIDATTDDGRSAAQRIASAIGFELRVLGYGGKANV